MGNVNVTKSLYMNQERQGGIIGLKGTLIGRRIEIKSHTEVILGRDGTKCDLVIHGEKVSRVHCGIIFNYYGNEYTVIDYSSNGTFVGDENIPIHKTKRRVPRGVVLKLGNDENIIQLN